MEKEIKKQLEEINSENDYEDEKFLYRIERESDFSKTFKKKKNLTRDKDTFTC